VKLDASNNVGVEMTHSFAVLLTIVCASSLVAQQRTARQRADSAWIDSVARSSTRKPDSARVHWLYFRGEKLDSAVVALHVGTLNYVFTFERRKTKWVGVPNPPGVGGR